MYRKNFPGRQTQRRVGVVARLKAQLPTVTDAKQRARISQEIAALESKIKGEEVVA